MTFDWAKPIGAGFRIITARQWSYLAWCAAGLVCLLASGSAVLLAFRGLEGPALARPQSARAMTAAAVALMAVLGSPIVCAIFRAVLRPSESRFAYLRVGKAELKVIAILEPLALAWLLLSFLATAAGPWKLAVLLAGGVALTPFTLAAPAVFDRGWGQLRDALSLGRRYFWEILGLNLLTFLAVALVNLPIRMGWRMFTVASEGDLISMIQGRRDPVFLAQLFLAFAVVWLFYGAATVVAVAPSAAAYDWLSRSGEPDRGDPQAALAADAQA